ncbi:MAG: sulfatase [Cytophagales bacterium]|nr:sulfatase [Cytophagales bacterium]
MKKIVLALIAIFACCCLFAQINRPNFLIVIGDDISWNDLGCYGHPTVNSPNVDRLAKEGIKFTNAYLTASSCSPSRCSILAGRYPHNTGAAELHTPLPEGMPTLPGALKKTGYYTASSGKWHLGPYVRSDFDLVDDKDVGNGGHKNWVSILRERPKDRPFFMWFAAHDAHRVWHADEFGTPHDPVESVVPPHLVDAQGTRKDLASYYNEIQRLDHYLGLVRDELNRQGILEHTLIIFMADNGRPFPGAKTRVYDRGMKTPFVLSWPEGQKSGGLESTSMISVIDIAPTLFELAGVEAGPTFQGSSFAKTIKNPSAEHRNYVFAEHNWHDYEAHERMVRTKHFMYVINNRPQFPNQGPADSNRSPSYADLKDARDQGRLSAAQADVFSAPRPHEELFDCVLDPEQVNNIASFDRYRPVLDDLRNILRQWSDQTGDDVPERLTKAAFDTESGKLLPGIERFNAVGRGEMPGTKTNAVKNNNKGPF